MRPSGRGNSQHTASSPKQFSIGESQVLVWTSELLYHHGDSNHRVDQVEARDKTRPRLDWYERQPDTVPPVRFRSRFPVAKRAQNDMQARPGKVLHVSCGVCFRAIVASFAALILFSHPSLTPPLCLSHHRLLSFQELSYPRLAGEVVSRGLLQKLRDA